MQHGRFARAGRRHQRYQLTRLDGERRMIEDGDAFVVAFLVDPRHLIEFQNRITHQRPLFVSQGFDRIEPCCSPGGKERRQK